MSKQGKKYDGWLAESHRQRGPNEDGTIAWLKKHNYPLTRENYLEVAYLGDVPNPFPAELESMLPEQFRREST